MPKGQGVRLVNEGLDGSGWRCLNRFEECSQCLPVGREGTRGIGDGRIPGQQGGLAPAPAEIHFAKFATATRFGHPMDAAKAVEGIGLRPNPGQRMIPHVIESEPFYFSGGGTGQHVTRGIDSKVAIAPSVHAGLGTLAVIVGDNEEQVHLPQQSFPGSGSQLSCSIDLVPRGQESGAVPESPTVILSVGQFEALSAEAFGKINHSIDPIDVAAMQDDVKAQSDSELADYFRRLQFRGMSRGAPDSIRKDSLVRLETDLNTIEAGSF